MLRDIRIAFRLLAKHKLSTASALLVLAVAIGANSALFSILASVLLTPPPYRDPERLVFLFESNAQKAMAKLNASPPNFKDWSEQTRSFEALAGIKQKSVILLRDGEPDRIAAAEVSAGLFDLLGVRAAIGRTFAASEGQPGANAVAVLGHELWRQRFGGRAEAVGTQVVLDGKSHTVIGVAPVEFRLLDTETQLWTPYVPDNTELSGRGIHSLKTVARLGPGVRREDAQAEMRDVSSRLERQYPVTNSGWTVQVAPLVEELVGDVQGTLWLLLAAVGLVLLVACANVGHLLLVRVGGREKETAVRVALGANPWQLFRQLLAESAVLAVAGGILGSVLAWLMLRVVPMVGAEFLPRGANISLDWRVVAFTLVACGVCVMVFGMVLLPSAFRADLHTGLKAGGRGGSTSSHWRVLRNVLVVTEIALSLALSIGAGLLIRSLSKLQNTRPGFQADRVLTFQLSLPDTRYKGQRVPDFYRRVIEGLGRLGAVEQAAVARNVPMAQGDPSVNFVVEGRAALVAAEQPRAQFRTVSADYFRALRIPLLRGRYLEPGDGADANKVAVINEAMAKQAFSGEDPIGRRIQNGFDESPWYTIVGIVGDVRHRGLDADARPEMYYPYQQVPESLLNFIEGTMTVVIRTRANPRAVLADARRVVRDVDSAQPLHNVRTMEELIYSNSAQPRFRTRLLGLFAALAVLLMIVGLYSVISHSVSERTREIAIRMSIGARTGDVLRLIVGHGLLLAGIGILAGLILSAGLVRGLRTMLYGVSSYDPVTIAGVVALVLGTAFLASFVPARKAASIDPLVALRSE